MPESGLSVWHRSGRSLSKLHGFSRAMARRRRPENSGRVSGGWGFSRGTLPAGGRCWQPPWILVETSHPTPARSPCTVTDCWPSVLERKPSQKTGTRRRLKKCGPSETETRRLWRWSGSAGLPCGTATTRGISRLRPRRARSHAIWVMQPEPRLWHLLAAGTRLAGDYDGAVELYRESQELNRRLGDSRGVGMELHNIGHVEIHRGNVTEAESCFAECAVVRDTDDLYESAMTDLNQAALSFARGDRDRAAQLLQRTQSTLDQASIVLDPDDAFEVHWLRGQLGEEIPPGGIEPPFRP